MHAEHSDRGREGRHVRPAGRLQGLLHVGLRRDLRRHGGPVCVPRGAPGSALRGVAVDQRHWPVPCRALQADLHAPSGLVHRAHRGGRHRPGQLHQRQRPDAPAALLHHQALHPVLRVPDDLPPVPDLAKPPPRHAVPVHDVPPHERHPHRLLSSDLEDDRSRSPLAVPAHGFRDLRRRVGIHLRKGRALEGQERRASEDARRGDHHY
mmetsp:Transcript_136501/g.236847  ORF Transcript_136501/g.236847 Transcript_136501/m.236847 type:complete len:208 (-) Transcript_136501:383-1006(-)